MIFSENKYCVFMAGKQNMDQQHRNSILKDNTNTIL